MLNLKQKEKGREDREGKTDRQIHSHSHIYIYIYIAYGVMVINLRNWTRQAGFNSFFTPHNLPLWIRALPRKPWLITEVLPTGGKIYFTVINYAFTFRKTNVIGCLTNVMGRFMVHFELVNYEHQHLIKMHDSLCSFLIKNGIAKHLTATSNMISTTVSNYHGLNSFIHLIYTPLTSKYTDIAKTSTNTGIYIYIYIYMCVCVCVCDIFIVLGIISNQKVF